MVCCCIKQLTPSADTQRVAVSVLYFATMWRTLQVVCTLSWLLVLLERSVLVW